MSIPNILSSHLGTDWMRPQMVQRSSSNTNPNSTTTQTSRGGKSARMRKSDFPPLSFYTAERPLPLYHTATSRRIAHLLNTSAGVEADENYSNTAIEGVDELSLELSCRLQRMKDINTYGYSWLMPAGVDKTMSQMLREVHEHEHVNEVDSALNPPVEESDVRADDADMWTGDDARMVGADSQNESGDVTGMMSENYGQMQERSGNSNQNQSQNHNSQVPNQGTDAEGYIHTENVLGRHGVDGDEEDDEEDAIEEERDLDADITNHDIEGDESYDYYEGTNSTGDHQHENNETDDYDVGNDAIVVEDDEFPGRNATNHQEGRVNPHTHVHFEGSGAGIITTTGQGSDQGDILHSSFIDASESFQVPVRKPRHRDNAEAGYFMAYEEYQDDHSMIEGQNNRILPTGREGVRSASFTDSAHTRESALSRPTNSSELTTTSMANPAILNLSTGNTSMDNNDEEYSRHLNASDYNMTLE
jgi:hypothetical protein